MQNTISIYSETGNHLIFSTKPVGWRESLLCLVLFFFPAIVTAQQDKTIAPSPATPTRIRVKAKTVEELPSVQKEASQTAVDSSFANDPSLLKILAPYRSRVRELDVVIGRLKGDLRKGGIGAGSLGYFVTDVLRAEVGRSLGKHVLLAVTNAGGLRKNTIAKGKLRVRDIFELLPFENSLIEIDLTGEQVAKLLAAVVSNRDAQSGARVTYLIKDNRPELVSAKFIDERGKETAIDEKATYTIVTIDYLYGLGGGRYSVLREGKNMKPLGITLREALLRYVKSQTALGRAVGTKLDDRFVNLNPDPHDEMTPQ